MQFTLLAVKKIVCTLADYFMLTQICLQAWL